MRVGSVEVFFLRKLKTCLNVDNFLPRGFSLNRRTALASSLTDIREGSEKPWPPRMSESIAHFGICHLNQKAGNFHDVSTP